MNDYVITKETDKYVWAKTLRHGAPESRYKKFLCIGGPFDGQMKASIQIIYNDYHQFNNAGSSKHCKAVYIYKDILNDL